MFWHKWLIKTASSLSLSSTPQFCTFSKCHSRKLVGWWENTCTIKTPSLAARGRVIKKLGAVRGGWRGTQRESSQCQHTASDATTIGLLSPRSTRRSTRALAGPRVTSKAPWRRYVINSIIDGVVKLYISTLQHGMEIICLLRKCPDTDKFSVSRSVPC